MGSEPGAILILFKVLLSFALFSITGALFIGLMGGMMGLLGYIWK